MFTKALLRSADGSCLLLSGNGSIPCYVTAGGGVSCIAQHVTIYINKNVNVRLVLIENLLKFFTDCFEILIQRCIRMRAFLYTYYIDGTPVTGKNMLLLKNRIGIWNSEVTPMETLEPTVA